MPSRRRRGVADAARAARGAPPRLGGAPTHRVPVGRRPARRETLGLRWLTAYSRSRGEKTMSQRLAAEIMDAANNTGAAVKKREDTHKMAEANNVWAQRR